MGKGGRNAQAGLLMVERGMVNNNADMRDEGAFFDRAKETGEKGAARADRNAHILVVDDDARLRDLLKRYLSAQGFQTSAAAGASEARGLMRGIRFDLMILDVMMPGEDGISFSRNLREELDIPIILLTARSETEDRLEGFAAGVDDFLAKPFEPRELVYRIEALLRRVARIEAVEGHVVFGPFSFDLARDQLMEEGVRIDLTRNEGALLGKLCREIGHVVSRAELSEALGMRNSGQRGVDVQVARLRKKLDLRTKGQIRIETMRGQGYRLAAAISAQ